MNLILAPMVISMAASCLTLFLYKKSSLQKGLSFILNTIIFMCSLALIKTVYQNGTQTVNLSSWDAPFGITFVADPLAAIMVGITGFISFGAGLYTFGGVKFEGDFRFFAPLFHLMMAGVFGAFLTGDIFNLYVCFELLLLGSFVLIILGRSKEQLEGGLKYVLINLISSGFFLAGLGLLYGQVGALNIAEITVRLQESGQPQTLLMPGTLLLIAFSIKAALFPLNFWLPASYPLCHPLLSGVFAGLLTKVGIYAILRLFPMMFIHDLLFFKNLLLVMAGLSMVTGVFGAAIEYNSRKILAYHSISQMGYITLGIAIFTPFSLAATFFYFIHYIITKTNLFLSAGLFHQLFGHDQIKKMGGLYRNSLLISAIFMISALSLAGLPPFSGFFGKFFILKAAYLDYQWTLFFTGIGVGLLTLFSMIKIWHEVFWKELPAQTPAPEFKQLKWGPLAATSLFTLSIIFIGIFAGALFDFSYLAAQQIIDPTTYIQAVLGR